MSEIPVFSVIAHRSDLAEEPGFRNDGTLRITDDEVQVRTTWWNWARHMAWPLGLVTSDLGMIFAGPTPTRDVVLTMRRSEIDSVVMHPDATPRPRIEITGTREESGEKWLVSFAYGEACAADVERLASHVPERTAAESA